jgi:hypothetical protein
VYWVNHTWLSDWLGFQLYREADSGRWLVIGKCLLLTLIAAMFICFRRHGTGLGVTAFAACLSLLAAGPWLLLQPFLFSLLGIILTLWLLERPRLVGEAKAGKARRARWLLLPLFALWANLDGWFLLGPLLVALYALGEGLTAALSSSPARLREFGTFALLTLAGLTACLLTPYHYHIFSWPTSLGLTHAEQAWLHDPAGRNLVISPFARPWESALAFSGPGGWAYCALLMAGVASFALCGRSMRLGRLLVWLVFAGLSVYQARTIPFFAVVAGPLLALNLGDWRLGTRRQQAEAPPRILYFARSILGAAVLAAGWALLVLAWPGWLQSTPYQPRAWSCEPDGSMVRLAGRLQQLRADPAFVDSQRSLNFSPEAAHYLAWFCPEEKGFVDSRLALFGGVADDYIRIRKGLLDPEPGSSLPELRALADGHQIKRIVLYDPDGERLTRAFGRLLQDPEGWELAALDGGAAVFNRRRTNVPSRPHLNPLHEAYQPEQTRLAPRTAPRAPLPPIWWNAFTRRRDVRNPDRAEAALLMVCFDALHGYYRYESIRRWRLSQAAALIATGSRIDMAGTSSEVAMRVGLSLFALPVAEPKKAAFAIVSGGNGLPDDRSRAGMIPGRPEDGSAHQLAAMFLSREDLGPPEWLLLAVRAARRAIAADPDDSGAYLALAHAYLLLDQQMAEQGWLGALPELAVLRHAQILTALEQAALLRPELDEPHALLAQIYYSEGQLDRALDHLRARLRIAEKDAKRSGLDAKAAAERERVLQTEVKNLDAAVNRAQETYDANTKGQNDPSQVLVRAKLAARHGLSRQALEMLLASNVAVFGREGAEMQLDLLLSAGRAFAVLDLLEPEQESLLGFQKYHILRARAAAGCGNYASADLELAKLDSVVNRIDVAPNLPLTATSAIAVHAADALLTFSPVAEPVSLMAGSFWRNYYLRVLPVKQMADRLRERADLHVVRGLLALEPGITETARREFRSAVATWKEHDTAVTGGSLDFFARPIAQEMLRRMEIQR